MQVRTRLTISTRSLKRLEIKFLFYSFFNFILEFHQLLDNWCLIKLFPKDGAMVFACCILKINKNNAESDQILKMVLIFGTEQLENKVLS
jgi:hypothetical protein